MIRRSVMWRRVMFRSRRGCRRSLRGRRRRVALWVPGWVMCGVSFLVTGLLSILMAGFWWVTGIRGLLRRVWVGWRVRVAMVGCSVRGGLGLTGVMAVRRAGSAMVVRGVRVLTGLVVVRGVLGERVGCSSVMVVTAVLVVMRWE